MLEISVTMSTNSAMTLAILFSLKSMETLENGLQPLFWSVIAELLQH